MNSNTCDESVMAMAIIYSTIPMPYLFNRSDVDFLTFENHRPLSSWVRWFERL